jgi:hypothetical protein
MSDSHRRPATPRQADDLFVENLRGLHPDATLSAAIDRFVRDRPDTLEEELRGQAADREDGNAKQGHRGCAGR